MNVIDIVMGEPELEDVLMDEPEVMDEWEPADDVMMVVNI
jgi:hypothetical protein